MPGFGPVKVSPRYLTVPLVGLTSPASARKNVDLPAPERPRILPMWAQVLEEQVHLDWIMVVILMLVHLLLV